MIFRVLVFVAIVAALAGYAGYPGRTLEGPVATIGVIR